MAFERRGFGGRFRGGGGFRGGPREDFPKPVKVGEEYEVEINEVGTRGDGIARVKNFVVFVNGVKKGDKTKIKITEVRNRFAIAEKVGGASMEESATEEAAAEPAAESEATEETTVEATGEETEEEEE